MIKSDKIKVKIMESSINTINYNYFNRQEHYNNDELSFTEYSLPYQHRPFGVNNIIIKECHSFKEIIVEFSGKILKHNYFELISINTLNEVESLISNSVVSLKPGSLADAQLLWMDVTNDLHLLEKIQTYISMLYYFRINHKYIARKYDNDGITFIKDCKTPAFKDRILFYDKQLELLKSKDMVTFVAPDRFENVLRVECNLKTFPQLRRHLKLDSEVITLAQALGSTQPVNYNILCDITDKYDISFVLENQDRSLHQIEKHEGRKIIIEKLNNDPKLYRKFIKDHLSGGSNPSYYNRQYKEILTDNLGRLEDHKNQLLIEIKNKLLAV